MLPVIPKDYRIDDLQLHKMIVINKIENVLSFGSKKLIKTASLDKNSLLSLFMKLLNNLSLMINDKNPEQIMDNVSLNNNEKKSETDNSFSKLAMSKEVKSERNDEIKIASKSVKDSNYQIDISKDIITKNSKKIIMVSCYARDSYLGRYLIKRNFFYTTDREAAANEAYDEILLKTSALKDRYYSEIIDVAGISTQIKTILDGVISELKFEEDMLGTTVRRFI